MSANPFKLHEKVDGSFTVGKTESTLIGIKDMELQWNRCDDSGVEYLTLDEILSQVRARTSFVWVWYESGLWGVIFEVGNYPEIGEQWIVHGVTKGYA